jgi:hypothetical protein
MKPVLFLSVLSLLSGCVSVNEPALNPPDRITSILGIDPNAVELHSNCEYAIIRPNEEYARFRRGIAVCTTDRVAILDQGIGEQNLKEICAFKYADVDYLRADSNKYVRQVQLVSSGRLLVFSHVQGGLLSNRNINSRFYHLIASKGVRVGEKARPILPPPMILVPVGVK